MDSEEEYEDNGDALAALEGALDAYAGTGDGADVPIGSGEPLAQYDEYAGEQYADEQADMQYEAPYPTYDANDHFNDPPSPGPGKALGQSFGASSSGLPEEIDVATSGLIEETVQKLSFIHGVLGVLIVDEDGRIVHATMPQEEAAQLSAVTLTMLQRARTTSGKMDDELAMLCVRTRKYEMLMCSEAQGKFGVCVLQDPAPAEQTESLVFAANEARSALRGTL